jgi:hypothetical protein
MTAVDVVALLVEQGMLLESARGPIPNVAELVAGEPISGSWWAHPESHTIFAAVNELADSPDVVRLRLVNGKITLVHRRLCRRWSVSAIGSRPNGSPRSAKNTHRAARTARSRCPSPPGYRPMSSKPRRRSLKTRRSTCCPRA